MAEGFSFCPICQLPLKAISIPPDLHVSECMTRTYDSDNEECVKGVHCLSTDVFHYRDFTHKLLAAYRSSSDFVPPDVEIKPSPKKRKPAVMRHSPRKARTPIKCQIDKSTDSDSDSDILVQPKRPRRNSQKSNDKVQISENSVGNRLKTINVHSKTKFDRSTTDLQSHSEAEQTNTVTDDSDDLDVTSSKKGNCQNNSKNKLTVLNVKLIEGKEVTLGRTHSRSHSPLSSLSVTTATSKNEDSDLDSEITLSSVKSKSESTPSKVMQKKPVCNLTKTKSTEDNFSSPSNSVSEKILNPQNKKTVKEQKENDTNISLVDADFEDIIPVSKLNKESIRALESKPISSPKSLYSCSELDSHADSNSSATDYVVQENEDLSDTTPSSPEVMIPPKCPKKPSAFLTSSSDSDIPLSSIVATIQGNLKKEASKMKSRLRSGGPVSSEVIVVGKEKAGKVLRTPAKAPVYLNGSLKSVSSGIEMNTGSDKESDSGKSSASKNTNSSFNPSERTSSSSNHSDSAYSAESTDRLASSSVTSTSTSSESYTNDHTSDLSYSEGSEDCIVSRSKSKQKITPKRNGKLATPTKNKRVVKNLHLHSESSSSEISVKEKLLFGNKKKSPPKASVKSDEPKAPSCIIPTLTTTVNQEDRSGWQTLLTKMRTGCFPSDLKIDSEDSLTVQSSCSSSDTSLSSMGLPGRQCPFYKRIPDTPFAVDAFQYWNIPGVKMYFLSHFHSDHYIGLKKSFSFPIYCTQITANLVHMKLRVAEKLLRVLELNKPEIICGVEVTALDANHCPGSVMFLFSLTNGRNYLHVGDFRACRAMTHQPSLRSITISKLFLDTTYCNPQYCFPTQEEVIGRIIDIVKAHVQEHPRTLVVCGSYTIGKEKVFLGIAEAMNWRVWARPEKQRIFTCLDDSRINSRLVKDFRLANVHVLPMGSIQIKVSLNCD
ncbi:DNA cross-link repair 1A protein-like [Homalodisca vitripennis]|uniref:DNA cross-link repair 1A protein-like n=1 Tax=Homalodisca vitripennis TaxID=197043 RepID=UPI001EEB7E32|nr:DNA cross-link repair 1A protein-like [Homalodisca vitripennis]